MIKEDLLEKHHDAIFASAAEIYRADKAGVDPDPVASRVNILPQNLGGMSKDALFEAHKAEAQVNVIARDVGALATLSDIADRGGVHGLIAKFEIGARRVIERPYTSQALQPGGIVDTLRGKTEQ